MRGLVRAAFGVVGVIAFASAAAADQRLPAEEWARSYQATLAKLPLCQDTNVLQRIANRFEETEKEYWNSSLTIVSFDSARPVAYRPWGLDFIPRRYCSASVTMSDNHRRRVEYSVIEDFNVAGWAWGVEWCVTGLDRAWAYRPNCKMARP
jgi:hypothetical protein